MKRRISTIGVRKSMALLGIFLLPASSGAQNLKAASQSPPTETVSDISLRLQNDPALQKQVSLAETDLPLGAALAQLGSQTPVELKADPRAAEQRITLNVTGQPLYRVMQRLRLLLSHSAAVPRSFRWIKVADKNSVRPTYRIERDAGYYADEQAALEFPRRAAIRQLRDFRTLLHLSEAQRKRYKTDLPEDFLTDPDIQPFRNAVQELTDAQLTTLLQTDQVPLDPTSFSKQIETYNKRWRENALRRQQAALASSEPDPYPNGVPDAPPVPPALTFGSDDYEGEHPERATLFGVQFEGLDTLKLPGQTSGSMHIVLTPLEDAFTPLPESKDAQEPQINLAPLLTNPDVTDRQRSDVGFTLAALAQAAKMNLYQEEFYKPVYWGNPSRGLQVMQGTRTQLINAICQEWGYCVTKVGDDYLFWSRTWAQDRAADVPESLLAAWRLRYQKQNGFTVHDRAEMAARLTWPQLRLTLNLALPESGPWGLRREANILRFLGRLSPSEQTRLTGSGLTFAALSAWHQEALLNELRARKSEKAAAQANSASLFMRPLGDDGQRTELELQAENGDSLWRMVLYAASNRAKTKP